MEYLSTNIQNLFLHEARPFTSKREINWARVKIVSVALIVVLEPIPQPFVA